MDSFIGIRFKKETAKRFRKFSQKHFKSHTEAMGAMLDFFFYNEISPREKLGPTGRTLEAKLLKRINAVIAIIRDVEKTQTKPTAAMIELLFQEEPPTKKPLILEKRLVGKKKDTRLNEEEKEMQRQNPNQNPPS